MISKTTSGGTGTFTFNVDCSDNAFDQQVHITGTNSVTISGGALPCLVEVNGTVNGANRGANEGEGGEDGETE